MKFDIRTLRWASILTGLLLTIIALSACSDSNAPAEDTTKSATTPTGTAEDTNRSTPGPEIDLASLDEYVDWCVQNQGFAPRLDRPTFRGASASLGEQIKILESRTPPSEVSDFHNAMLAVGKSLKDYLDAYPGSKDDPLNEGGDYLFDLYIAIGLPQFEGEEALRSMPVEVRDRLVAGGCVDESLIEGLGTEVTVGESVEATSSSGQINTFYFRAKQGERYVIEAVRGTLPHLNLRVQGTYAEHEGRLGGETYYLEDGEEKLSVRVEALSSEPFRFEVWANDTGSITLTVRADRSPSSPLNVRSAWEDSGVRVNWDSVDGADYYIIYHDFGRHTGDNPDRCYIDIYGRADTFSCNELASNVVETTYVHTTPEGSLGSAGDLYWVAACNTDGCSDTAPEPAIPTGQEPPAVTLGSGAAPVATPPPPTPTPSATAVPQSTPTSSSPTDRARFEDDTPPGYTAVALSDNGVVWGNPNEVHHRFRPRRCGVYAAGEANGVQLRQSGGGPPKHGAHPGRAVGKPLRL